MLLFLHFFSFFFYSFLLSSVTSSRASFVFTFPHFALFYMLLLRLSFLVHSFFFSRSFLSFLLFTFVTLLFYLIFTSPFFLSVLTAFSLYSNTFSFYRSSHSLFFRFLCLSSPIFYLFSSILLLQLFSTYLSCFIFFFSIIFPFFIRFLSSNNFLSLHSLLL